MKFSIFAFADIMQNSLNCFKSKFKSPKQVQGDAVIIKGNRGVIRGDKLAAFSIVELMLSLIIISMIAAAFAPVITKRLSGSLVTLNSSESGSSEITTDCTSKFTKDCKACTSDTCLNCKKKLYF